MLYHTTRQHHTIPLYGMESAFNQDPLIRIKTVVTVPLSPTGPAKESVYGDFLDFVKSEEKAFSKLQDYKKEEFEEKQKALEINSKLEAILEEQKRVEATMVEEIEEHRRQAMELNEKYNERIDKMKDEEK